MTRGLKVIGWQKKILQWDKTCHQTSFPIFLILSWTENFKIAYHLFLQRAMCVSIASKEEAHLFPLVPKKKLTTLEQNSISVGYCAKDLFTLNALHLQCTDNSFPLMSPTNLGMNAHVIQNSHSW
jgi:hypothetical protein